MRQLTSLSLSGNYALTDLTPLSRLPRLQLLDLSGCSAVQDFGFLRELRELRILDLIGCDGLWEISALEELGELRELGLSSCSNLSALKPLLRLRNLRALRVSGCDRVDDFQPLAAVPSLEALDLSYCTELTDLRFSLSLPHLKHLDVSMCHRLVDLTPVAHLTQLRNLRLRGIDSLTHPGLIAGILNLESLQLAGCSQLTDIRPVAGLSHLRSLDFCGCEQLTDLSPLSGLVQLEHLIVSCCPAITDLRCLGQLTHLRSLNLSGCARISDLSVLGGLSQLQDLDLTDCAELNDLNPLTELPRLQDLQLTYRTQLAEPALVSKLTHLESLHLDACEQLTDVGWLARLSGLRRLSLNDCNQLTDFSPLAALSCLERLEVSSKRGQFANLHELRGLAHLENLSTSGIQADLRDDTWLFDGLPRLGTLTCSGFRGAPRELARLDCLPTVERWREDLRRSGFASNADIKVFFLGNGHAGKTQIVRRLAGLEFDPTVPSTHGIDIARIPFMEASQNQPAIYANVWDFGGQDIYLGTHSLFLDNRAIYVLVWTPQTEHDGILQDGAITLQHRRLDYWLEYVRELVGTEAPIVVVQSQCDLESQAREAPVPAQHEFTWLRRTACSAAREEGMEQLWPTLKAAARLLLERHGEVRLPKSWVTVSETLRQIAAENVKVLSREQFTRIALEAGASERFPVLDYLHQSGQVFWKRDVFGGDVVLHQAWALKGIYTVLTRPHVMPLLRQMSGHFSRELLGQLLWDLEYTPEEQQHFISMMVSCGACFPVSEGHWIAVDCLPERSAVAEREAQVWRGAMPDATVIVHYDLLHDGIRRSLLHAVGKVAGQYAVYWRYGVCLFDARQKALIRIHCRPFNALPSERAGEIVVETCGMNAAACAREIISSIRRGIRSTRELKIEWVGNKSNAMISRDERAVSDERELNHPFAHIKAAPAPLPTPSDKPVVHVSYAWRGESEAVVNALEVKLNAHFLVRRDKSVLEPGEWISRFMLEIGRSRCVVVVLSDRYLRSSYCMRELLYLYQSALAEKCVMLRRIVPIILPDVAIVTLPERLSYARFWSEHCTALEASRRHVDDLSQGEATRRELLLAYDFKHYIVDMLTWVSDVLMPRAGAVSEAALADAVIELARKNLQAQRSHEP